MRLAIVLILWGGILTLPITIKSQPQTERRVSITVPMKSVESLFIQTGDTKGLVLAIEFDPQIFPSLVKTNKPKPYPVDIEVELESASTSSDTTKLYLLGEGTFTPETKPNYPPTLVITDVTKLLEEYHRKYPQDMHAPPYNYKDVCILIPRIKSWHFER